MKLAHIVSFWMGPRLSFLEQLCLKSFADLGHKITLFTYEPIEGLPASVIHGDASTILPIEMFHDFKSRGAAALFSDKFRLHLLVNLDVIWVDCDAYAWKSIPKSEYLFSGDVPSRLATGVLALPKSSPALLSYLEFTNNLHPKFPLDWPHQTYVAREETLRLSTENAHIAEMPMWNWGPVAFTYFMRQSGEIQHKCPPARLYPLDGMGINQVFKAHRKIKALIPDDCLSVHFYGSLLRRKLRSRFPDGDIPHGSFLRTLCEKHGINPLEAPVAQVNIEKGAGV